MKTLLLLATLCLAFAAQAARADADTEMSKAKEDTKQAAHNTGKLIKKGGRAASDEACPLVNGKVNCAAKKLKHKAQNAGDSLKD